jgi:hypothetical protein
MQTSKSTEPPPDAPRVELTVSSVRGVAWGPLQDGWPGIVFYSPHDGGDVLDATRTLRGSKQIGDGRATRLPEPHAPHIAGAYDVQYRLGGRDVGRFRLEIANEAGTRYQLRWLQPIAHGAVTLEGTGEWIESKRLLVAAWAKPGMTVHIAYTVTG